jgi:hypothetical protein
VPRELIEQIKWWRNLGLGGNLGSVNPQPRLIKKTPEADARHEQYCEEVHGRHGVDSAIHKALWSRAPEKAAKLALIFACCSTNETPRITLEAENWGIKLANYSTRLVLQAAQNSVAGSKYESDLKRVWMAIGNGCTQNDLTRKTQWLKQRERAEILSDLQVRGAIQMAIEATEKRPRTWVSKRRVTL